MQACQVLQGCRANRQFQDLFERTDRDSWRQHRWRGMCIVRVGVGTRYLQEQYCGEWLELREGLRLSCKHIFVK